MDSIIVGLREAIELKLKEIKSGAPIVEGGDMFYQLQTLVNSLEVMSKLK